MAMMTVITMATTIATTAARMMVAMKFKNSCWHLVLSLVFSLRFSQEWENLVGDKKATAIVTGKR